MIKKTFTQKAKVWIYPGVGGWHFVNIDKDISARIIEGQKPIKSAMIKVHAKIDRVKWDTALFKQKQTQTFLLPIKKKVQSEAGVLAGDTVTVSVEII